ncbi:hypothetical protein [Streptomyces sp. LMG1-1-1.1]|uniref:hypothetical protein n=1 Tax=Streptomyces sp. LMG1-1-1.1 TaxID=3135245 RepID=UPI003466E874
MTSSPARSHDHATVYAEEDLGEVDSALFTRRTVPGTGVVVAGTCPRCHGRTESLFAWALPGTGTKGVLGRLLRNPDPSARGAAEPDPLTDETHFCECGHAHPACPPDTSFRGCGASWRVR